MQRLLARSTTFLGSRKFFCLTLGLFVVGATWLVFTSRYPMAFDENYHYEIIQTYAKQWSPFFSQPPAHTEQLGDITRYPSYLFHYLMSFPYRLISLFTDSDSIKIILLRLINVTMLATSFWIFKRLFETLKLSNVAGNLSLFVFSLIPITPFLGAHISYDNATIPLTVLTLLAAVHILAALRSNKISAGWLLAFLSIGLLTSLVKYTYLPIFVALFFYLTTAALWARHKRDLKLWHQFKASFSQLTRLRQLCLLLVLLLGVLLCVERYGLNMLRYKNPVPDCNQILSVQSCQQYGPWARDYKLKQRQVSQTPTWKIADYSRVWLNTTLHEFFFAINYDYANKPPLMVLYTFAKVYLIIGLVASLIMIKRIFRHPALRLFTFISVFYVLVVWLDNYMKFYHVHWPVAIHGRYLLPLVPVMAVVLAYGIRYVLEMLPTKVQQYALGMMAFMLLLGMSFGGGALTYIARSDSDWYWPNQTVIRLNTKVKSLLRPVLK